jgi:hypothetical protein
LQKKWSNALKTLGREQKWLRSLPGLRSSPKPAIGKAMGVPVSPAERVAEAGDEPC